MTNGKFNLIIKSGAAHDTVEVETDGGKTIIDRSLLTKVQHEELGRLVTNGFCDHAGYQRLHG